MQGSKHPLSKLAGLTPWIAGIGSFILYLATMVRDVVPGTSVRIINTVNGLYYLPVLPHFLYSSLAKLVVRVMPGPTLMNLNLISAVFGSLSIVLFVQLLNRLPMFVVHDKASPIPAGASRASKSVAILASALFVMFCAPLWTASTRPDNHTFDLFILLSCFWMVLQYARANASVRWIMGAALLYGLGVTEYATMIALGPVFVIAALVALLYRRALTAKRLWLLVALGFCGLLFYIVPVGAVARLPEWGYQEYSGFWNVLLDLWRKQYLEVKSIFPRVGGLLIALCAFVPWIYVYLVPRPDYGSTRLAHALTIVTLLVLNVLGVAQILEKGMTPTIIMGLNDPFLIPYLAIASWMGYLAGYWWFRAVIPSPNLSSLWMRPVWKTAAIANLVIAIVTAVMNYIHFVPPRTPELTALIRNIVRSCENRPVFVVSRSFMDDMILHAAFEEGQPERIVMAQDISRPSYRRYLSTLFPECNINASAYATQTDILKAIVSGNAKGPAGCSLFNPDLTLSIGYQFVPNGLVVRPVENLSGLKASEVYLKNVNYFENTFANQLQAVISDHSTNTLKMFVRQNYSRCANNLGVTLQLLKSDDLAQKAYDLALKILPQNPSALLNQRAIYLKEADSGGDTVRSEMLTQKAQALLERAQREAAAFPKFLRSAFMMTANYGYLYSEHFALNMANIARRGGQRDMEAGAINQARMINPDSLSVKISSALLAQGKGDLAEAEAEYRSILQTQPDNISARIGLAVAARDMRDYAKAIQVLEENPASAANVNARSLLALLYLENRDTARGEDIYNQLLSTTNQTTLSASFIAMSAWQLNQYDKAELFARKVLAVDAANLPMLKLMASVAQKKGDLATALSHMKTIEATTPQDTALRENIIRLSMQLRRNSEARKKAEELLSGDPGNMIGNLAMASLMDTPEARETYLRRCLKNRDNPLYDVALNNLAYDLVRMGRFTEAMTLAQEAVNLKPSNDKYHHTLAEACKGLGQYDKAMEHILLASTIDPDDANHTLVQGEILIAQGQAKNGFDLAVKALPNLSGEWRERALKVLKR